MNGASEYRITYSKFRNKEQYTLHWSPYYRLDRFLINRQVPSEAGIYQIFHKKSHHLVEINTDIAYYGGLRATLREMTDGLSPRKFPFKEIMKTEPCFFRYVISPSMETLKIVMSYMEGKTSELSNNEVAQIDHNGLILNF